MFKLSERAFSVFLLIVAGMGAATILGCGVAETPFADPGPDTECPVCGMRVADYPAWVARVEFQDGSVEFFDGAKDMFKFLQDIPKYRPEMTVDQVAAISVTEYETARRIDARTASFVIGSDVSGPMGNELVPFESEDAAAEFRAVHSGERIVRFDEVDQDLISELQ